MMLIINYLLRRQVTSTVTNNQQSDSKYSLSSFVSFLFCVKHKS